MKSKSLWLLNNRTLPKPLLCYLPNNKCGNNALQTLPALSSSRAAVWGSRIEDFGGCCSFSKALIFRKPQKEIFTIEQRFLLRFLLNHTLLWSSIPTLPFGMTKVRVVFWEFCSHICYLANSTKEASKELYCLVIRDFCLSSGGKGQGSRKRTN